MFWIHPWLLCSSFLFFRARPLPFNLSRHRIWTFLLLSLFVYGLCCCSCLSSSVFFFFSFFFFSFFFSSFFCCCFFVVVVVVVCLFVLFLFQFLDWSHVSRVWDTRRVYIGFCFVLFFCRLFVLFLDWSHITVWDTRKVYNYRYDLSLIRILVITAVWDMQRVCPCQGIALCGGQKFTIALANWLTLNDSSRFCDRVICQAAYIYQSDTA